MRLKMVAFACILGVVVDGAWAIIAHALGVGGAIEVRPASGLAKPAPAAAASDAAGAAAPAAAKGRKLSFEEWDRKTYLENRGIFEANADIDSHNVRCDERRRALLEEKRNAQDSLTAAVLANTSATEIQALATECASRLQQLTTVRNRLEDELQRLREKERASK